MKKRFIVFCFFVLSNLIFTDISANSIDLDLSQYSDRNITENAKISDSQYSNLAFDPVPTKTNTISGNNQVASVLRAFSFWFNRQPEKENIIERGTWVWTPIMQMTPEYMTQIISSARSENINTIYLSVDSYLDIFALSPGEEKKKKAEEFANQINLFVLLADQAGIAVDAEAGWRNWAEQGHTYKAFAIVDFVKKYNSSYDHKFRGFQYDVEPYLLDEFKESKSGKAAVLQRFIKLIDETEHFLTNSNLAFSVVVPDFYDKYDKATPKFEYGGKNDFAFGHLLRILEDKPGASVIIMSYRNFAKGKDGSIEVSKNEMRTARNGYYSTRVILGQETGDVSPAYITFHNTSKLQLTEQTRVLANAFLSYRNYGGLAIHYANSFFTLK